MASKEDTVSDPYRRLRELVSDELQAITFVRDYVQLQFGTPAVLNAYNPVTVRVRGIALRSGEPGFPNLLVEQINKTVLDVRTVPDERIEILFDDASSVEVSLREEDFRSAEAFEYFAKDGGRLIG